MVRTTLEIVVRVGLLLERQRPIGDENVLFPPIITIFLDLMSGHGYETRITQDRREIIGSFAQFYLERIGVHCPHPQPVGWQLALADGGRVGDVGKEIVDLRGQHHIRPQDASEAGDEIGCLDGSAIAPRDARSQMEPVGQTIVGNVPRFGVSGLHFASFVEQEQGKEQRAHECDAFRSRRIGGVDRFGRLPHTDAQGRCVSRCSWCDQ